MQRNETILGWRRKSKRIVMHINETKKDEQLRKTNKAISMHRNEIKRRN